MITAALPLLAMRGSDVTTREIAQAAGIAEGTIFRVFPDKEALIQAALRSAFDPTTTLRQLAEVDRGLPLAQRLSEAVDILRHRLTDVTRLMAALRMFGPPEDHQKGTGRPVHPEDTTARLTQALVDVIGPSEQELRVPAEFAARILRLFVFSATHPRITEGEPLRTEEIVSVLLDGMRTRSTTSPSIRSSKERRPC